MLYLPTYLPTCLPACLPTYLPTYLPLSGGILKKIHVFSSTAYNSGGPSICKHSAHMVDFKRNSHAAKQACTSGRLVGRSPPACNHYCLHGEWRGFFKTLIMRGGLLKRLRGCEQACTRLKTAGGLGGGRSPPPFANTMLAWLVSKKYSYAVKQACASGGLVGRSLPVCKHTARMVNGAVSIRLILCMASSKTVKQACTRLNTAGGGFRGWQHPPFANTILAKNHRLEGRRPLH